MSTLFITVDRGTYIRVVCGVQLQVYRRLNQYWIRRFCNSRIALGCNYHDCESCFRTAIEYWEAFPFDQVCIRNFCANSVAEVLFNVKNITFGYGKPEWGADPESMYLIVNLGNKV